MRELDENHGYKGILSLLKNVMRYLKNNDTTSAIEELQAVIEMIEHTLED